MQLDKMEKTMSVLNGIKNFLAFIDSNWTSILVIIGLIIGIGQKLEKYLSKSDEEKIAIAKKKISEAMLKMITEAEVDFSEWKTAGAIKRSQVIDQIYKEYPILSKAIDQDAIIAFIDAEIDNSLKTLRKILEENKKAE